MYMAQIQEVTQMLETRLDALSHVLLTAEFGND